MYQMTIFDIMQNEHKYPSLIEEFKKDTEQILGTPHSEEYEIWSHVPKFGKRYSAMFDDFLITDEVNEKLMTIKKKFDNTSLEVSFLFRPSIRKEGMFVIHAFTTWKTKGYKEVL